MLICVAFNIYFVFKFGIRSIGLITKKYHKRIEHKYFKKPKAEVEESETSEQSEQRVEPKKKTVELDLFKPMTDKEKKDLIKHLNLKHNTWKLKRVRMHPLRNLKDPGVQMTEI